MANRYSKEFKVNAVREVIKNNHSVKNVAEELTISPSTLYNWISVYRDYGEFIGSGNIRRKEKREIKQLSIENKILKKALHVPNRTVDKFRFIYKNNDKFPIQVMCNLLNVSSSGYYKFAKNYLSREEMKNEYITELVREVYLDNDGKVGSPKITKLLNKEKVLTSQATVARILAKNKDEWRTTYTDFHDDKDVQLHFHNKDTVYDIFHDIYYHQELAQKEITSLFDAAVFSNYKKHGNTQVTRVDDFSGKDNILIQGDNLVALNKLNSTFKGKIKLVYIDVPYNTERGDLSYLDHHSRHAYLLMLKNRIEIARDLLREDGTLFLHCDDREQAYIKVLCDELFGEDNFINQIIWRRSSGQHNRSHIATTKEYILVYSKNRSQININRRELTEEQRKNYQFEDVKGKFRIDKIQDKVNGYYTYEITSPSGEVVPSRWLYPYKTFKELKLTGQIYWSQKNLPYKKVYLSKTPSRVVNDLWTDVEKYGSTRDATLELDLIANNNSFTYPKPEKLLQKIIEIATDPKDIVLDFYAGSGTTLAVAHKMNRQFIGIELLEDNFNLMVKRLQNALKKDSPSSKPFITCKVD